MSSEGNGLQASLCCKFDSYWRSHIYALVPDYGKHIHCIENIISSWLKSILSVWILLHLTIPDEYSAKSCTF